MRSERSLKSGAGCLRREVIVKRPARISFLSVLVLLFSVAIVADAPEVRTLKNAKFARVEVPGARITEARGLNNLGEIVGSWEDPITRREHGFIFSGGVFTTIDIPGAVSTSLLDINDAGDIVGAYSEPAGLGHGFLLTADGQLTTITFPGQRFTGVNGINNHRQIVGIYAEVEGDEVLGIHGFIRDENGVFTPVDFPVPTPRAHIFVTFANDINDAGDIVGGYNEDDIFETRRGFLLRNGEYTTINVPASVLTEVFGINNAGEMVGEFLGSGQNFGFFFSPKRGFYRMGNAEKPKPEFPGGLLPFDINDLNQFAGDGGTADGLRGFVATLPPGW